MQQRRFDLGNGSTPPSPLAPGGQKPTSVFGLCATYAGRTVAIPFETVTRTQGSVAYMAHLNDNIPQVCLPFVAGACPIGDLCPQIHVRPAYVKRLENGEDGNCCAYCGDPFSREIMRVAPALQLRGPFKIEGHWFPMERFALTACIQKQQSNTDIPDGSICREHVRGICPRSKDCPLFHPCRNRLAAVRAVNEAPNTSQRSSDND